MTVGIILQAARATKQPNVTCIHLAFAHTYVYYLYVCIYNACTYNVEFTEMANVCRIRSPQMPLLPALTVRRDCRQQFPHFFHRTIPDQRDDYVDMNCTICWMCDRSCMRARK